MKTISISLKPETVEAITTEAEIRDFDSRSAYLRYIVQNRGQVESLDQTEVEVVEAVAERIKEHHHEKISDIEDHLQNLQMDIKQVYDVAEQAERRYNYIEKMEKQISEIQSTTNSNESKLADHNRELQTSDREVRENEKEIENLKRRIRALKSDIREVHQSDSGSI